MSEDDIVCPSCNYSAEPSKEWHMYFCPSWPDRCAGCEVHEDRYECPECGYDWEIKRSMLV